MTATPPPVSTGCVGLRLETLNDDCARDIVRAVLCAEPSTCAAGRATRWCLGEFTDGRLTGVLDGDAWALSIDEFPDDGPARLSTDGSDWWRLRSLRVFDTDREEIITGCNGRLNGVRLTDEVSTAGTHTETPQALQPRERRLVVTSDSPAEFQIEELTGADRVRRRPGTVSGERFAQMSTPSGNVQVVPLPLKKDDGVPSTRLVVREYFASTDTGAVGVRAHRLVRFDPSQGEGS